MLQDVQTIIDIYSTPITLAAIAVLVFTLISILSGLLGIADIFTWFRERRSSRKEFLRSLRLLKASDYFIAQIIHVGGQFSNLYSIRVFRNDEGGYYLNPPKKFVWVGFTRGGDLINVSPSFFTEYYGFIIDSVSSDSTNWKTEAPYMAQWTIADLRTEFYVKFVKLDNHLEGVIFPHEQPGIIRKFFVKSFPYAYAIFTGAHRRM